MESVADKLYRYILSLDEVESKYILQDLPRWVEITNAPKDAAFVELWVKRQEFRTLIKYRVKMAEKQMVGCRVSMVDIRKIVGNSSSLYVSNLFISCNYIGAGFYIEHGFSTIIFAKRIGKNFWVNQNVTIGTGSIGNPIIQDNVRVGANSVIIGGITVQDDVTIGAGTTLNFEVEAGSTVVSQKARVLPRSK